jgi:hypothetical protein
MWDDPLSAHVALLLFCNALVNDRVGSTYRGLEDWASLFFGVVLKRATVEKHVRLFNSDLFSQYDPVRKLVIPPVAALDKTVLPLYISALARLLSSSRSGADWIIDPLVHRLLERGDEYCLNEAMRLSIRSADGGRRRQLSEGTRELLSSKAPGVLEIWYI